MSKSIKLSVIKKWLSNKTFHKTGCFHWRKEWVCPRGRRL